MKGNSMEHQKKPLLYLPKGLARGEGPNQELVGPYTETVLGDLCQKNQWRTLKSLAKHIQKELDLTLVNVLGLLEDPVLVNVERTAEGDSCMFVGIPDLPGPLYRIDLAEVENVPLCERAVLRYSAPALEVLTVIQRVLFRYNGITMGGRDAAGYPTYRFKRFFPYVDFAPWLQTLAVAELRQTWTGRPPQAPALITPVPWLVPSWLGDQGNAYLAYNTFIDFTAEELTCKMPPEYGALVWRALTGLGGKR